MRRTWKNFLSLLLALAMILSLGTAGFALDDETEAAAPAEETAEEISGTGVELPFEKVDNDIISERLPLANAAVEEAEPPYADDEPVRVSIVLSGASAIDAGYAPASAGSYRAGLRAQQDAMASKISAQALDGAQLDVVWNLTLACNIISAYVPYGSIDAIRNVIGVQDVVLEQRYFPTEDQVQNITASEMTGASEAWNLGYTGAGSTIAVVDTGLDLAHRSFDPDAFEYAIDELNETRDVPVKLLTEADIAAAWDQLNAASFLDVDGVYRSAKVPFAVNYVDRDYDVSHDNDKQGEHGSHVAGIAAANKYVPGGNGFERALDAVKTQGEAPDAQLLIMKVFGKGGGAYDSDYMIAIEDAMTLGCDAVNLSLGSASAGFTNADSEYTEILNKLTQYGLVWCNSAGNNSSWSASATGANYLYADDVNYHTGGSPGTYHNALTVASVDNKGSVGYTITASDGTEIAYSETSYGNEPLRSIAGAYDFIMLTRAGSEEEDFAALGSEILSGKVAIAWRGGSSFYVKANGGARNGAVATLVANNQAGVINMNLTGYEFTAPAVSITQNDGVLLMNMAEQKEANGITYFEGKLTINDQLSATNVGTPTGPIQTMSSFSSWGGNGALTMKPEITAPGGNIWSVWGSNAGDNPTTAHDQYENMSGTSMASPQVAGVVAVLKQYARESGLAQQLGITERAVAQSLLMTTAMPLYDDYGLYWSIMKQGAGLVDVNAAITARSIIQITGLPALAPESAYDAIADGKAKVELGQVYNGFSTSFNVTNFSDEELQLYLSGDFFTQLIDGYFRTEYTDPVYANINWKVNGQTFVPADVDFDFNGDGVTSQMDAQVLLNWCADDSTEIYNLEDADLDGDGNVDTADAKIAFEQLNAAAVTLAAGETASITATVSYDMSDYDAINGNYVEGFLYVREGDTADGALGVEHSIPVYGFNGDFSAASMFDRGSRLEYLYRFGDGETGLRPYMWFPDESAGGLGEDAFDVESFLVQYAGDSNFYDFGGNPLLDDETYHPERNALNAGDVLAGVSFTQIRNAGASRFYVTDKYDRVVKGSEMQGGASYAAYYYPAQAKWKDTTSTAQFNYIPRNVKEGSELTAHYQLALEYFVDSDGYVRWDELGAGSELAIPFVIDNTAPDIVTVYRDSSDGTEEEEAADVLTVTVHDNQYIAAVALFTDKGELKDAQGALEDVLRGKEVEYSFDLKGIFGDKDVYPYLLVQVYDYARNLATYKVNLVDDLSDAEVKSVKLNTNEANVVVNNSIRLSADVLPWGIDDAVTWTSSNEKVAVVNDEGLVTGVSEGTAVITAASALDPTKSDSCEVTVKFVDKELNGIVWDENGEVWFSDFNLKTLPEYNKLNASNMRIPLASTAYDGEGNLYAATMDSTSMTSTLYKVNENDWSVEAVGDESSIPYMDICASPNSGENMLLAVYGTYLLQVDKTTGQYVAPFRSGATANLVGIAYVGAMDYSAYGYGIIDMFILLDKQGNLYEGGILNQDEFPGYLLTPSKVDNLGYTTDQNYFQSLYFDGVNLYWSCFNMSTNKVDMIMVDDLYGEGMIYQVGSFANGVWPVGGLYESGKDAGDLVYSVTEPASVERISDEYAMSTIPVLFNEAPVDPAEEPVLEEEPEEGFIEDTEDAEDENDGVISGSLTAVRSGGTADQQKIDTMVLVNITADELMYNGKIEVNFDPSTAKLVSVVSNAQFTGVLDRRQDLGRYVLAWVDLDGISQDEVIATLMFTTDSKGTVTITTLEENANDSDSEQGDLPREELVFLGTAPTPADHEHKYSEVKWNWAEDLSAAAAIFTCPEDGASKTVEAEVSRTAEPGLITYTATVEFEGETYTDTKTVEVPVPQFKSHALKLSGSIGVTFFMELPEIEGVDWNDSYMIFTLNGVEKRVAFDPKNTNKSGAYFGFECPINAVQMAEPITAEFHYSEDDVVISEEYSVKDYMEAFQAKENLFDAKMVALVHSIADYGHYVQPFLAAENKWVVGEDYAEMDLFFTESYDIDAIKAEVADYAIVREPSQDITAIGYALALDAGTDLRVMFKPAAGFDGDIAFAIDGAPAEATLLNDGRYMVVIPAISAHQLGDTHVVTATTDNGTATAELSVMSYVQGMLAASRGEAADNAMAALYSYFKAAVAAK